jgi:hypothetical protein
MLSGMRALDGYPAALRRLDTPPKIQSFLDKLPMNWEKRGETHHSALAALRAKKAHCIEGALIAAAALKAHGGKPLLMDLYAVEGAGDDDHVIALYKKNGYWGAISKTNHATIRFRDPVYKTLRELALSYFHEWFMNTNGLKTLESYSTPLNLDATGLDWLESEEDLWELDVLLNARPHYKLIPAPQRKYLRRADRMELKAGRLEEWKKSDPRT